MHARYAQIDDAAARNAVIEHAPSLEERELGPVRVSLLAAGFGPSVSSVVLWLNDVGLDIACVQLVVRRVDKGQAVLSTRQVLPPPQAKDYLVRRRRRDEVEERREAKKKKRQTVALLNDHEAVAPGTRLELMVERFPDEQRRPSRRGFKRIPPTGRRSGQASPAARRCDGGTMGRSPHRA